MANNFVHANLSARANPFGIMTLKGVQFMGAIESYSGCFIKFQSRLYAIRAMFSLMRYWQRSRGSMTVKSMVEQIYWFDDSVRGSFLIELSFRYGLDPNEPLDYHSDLARMIVKALAKYVSRYDLKDEDIQAAQHMIL